jgi:ABC-type bacteriocin/lantibiotic exporter with double-glycine peptidase domain
MLAIGASLIIGGYLGEGAFLAFQALMNSFLKPVNMLITAGQNIQEMRSYAERIDDVMKYPTEADAEEEDSALQDLEGVQKLSGNVELKNITFGYSRLAEPLLKDFSLSIPAGAKVYIRSQELTYKYADENKEKCVPLDEEDSWFYII